MSTAFKIGDKVRDGSGAEGVIVHIGVGRFGKQILLVSWYGNVENKRCLFYTEDHALALVEETEEERAHRTALALWSQVADAAKNMVKALENNNDGDKRDEALACLEELCLDTHAIEVFITKTSEALDLMSYYDSLPEA